jgi:hypothetical protein
MFSIQLFGSTYGIASVDIKNIYSDKWRKMHRSGENFFPLKNQGPGPFTFRVTFRDGGVSFTKPITLGTDYISQGAPVAVHIPYVQPDPTTGNVVVTNANCADGSCVGVANSTAEAGDVNLARRSDDNNEDVTQMYPEPEPSADGEWTEEEDEWDPMANLDTELYPPVEVIEPDFDLDITELSDEEEPAHLRARDGKAEPRCHIGFTVKSKWTDQISANHSIQLTALTDVPKGWYLSLSVGGKQAFLRSYSPAKLPLLEGKLGPKSPKSYYQLHSVKGTRPVPAGGHLANIRLSTVHPYGKPEKDDVLSIVAVCDNSSTKKD